MVPQAEATSKQWAALHEYNIIICCTSRMLAYFSRLTFSNLAFHLFKNHVRENYEVFHSHFLNMYGYTVLPKLKSCTRKVCSYCNTM